MTNLRLSQVTGSGNLPLNVIEKGDPDKPAIVFIHGYRQSTLSWIYQFESRLADTCHLIAYDLRGHGNSGQPWWPGAYSDRKVWADDLAAVLKATGAQKPMIVAWSFGGNVAMDFLRYHPEVEVGKLMLVGSSAGLFKAPPPKEAQQRPTAGFDIGANIDGANHSAKLLFGDTLDPALVSRFVAASMRVSPFVDRGIQPLGLSDNTDIVATIKPEVTLVFGGKDIVVPKARAQQIAALFKGATRVTYTNAAHAPFLENPDRFNESLDVAQCSARATSANPSHE